MNKPNIQEYINMLGDIPPFLNKYLDLKILKRLKRVGYFCGMDYGSKHIYNFGYKISRYDHSLTTALITWKFTKDKRQTLLALFHDVSTPCFSHVIDYMNKDYANQESTEEKTEEIIKSDDVLMEYLKQDHILVDDIIDFKRYSVVDIDRPKLCADRLDGIILTGLYWTKSLNIDDVSYILNDVMITRNEANEDEIAFKNKGIAKLVLKTSNLIDKYCSSKEDNYMMQLLSKITKLAIKKDIIKYEDLYYLTEDKVFKKFMNSNDSEIINLIEIFQTISKNDIPETELPNLKARILNPLVNKRRLKRM